MTTNERQAWEWQNETYQTLIAVTQATRHASPSMEAAALRLREEADQEYVARVNAVLKGEAPC